MLTADIKQKFIDWATRGRLNNQYNNKGSDEEWRLVFFTFPQSKLSSLIAPRSHELYMAVLMRIGQCFRRPDRTNWDQVMDHYLKVCKEFA